MIRKLASDELVWFLSRSLAFQGHSDPMGLAQRLRPLLHDPRHDAERCYVLIAAGAGSGLQGGATPAGVPVAGVSLRAPDPDDDDQSLHLAQPWYEGDPEQLGELLRELFARFPHEAVYLKLHGMLEPVATRLEGVLAPLGFERDDMVDVRFELSEAPPIGRPLVLEAWNLATDGGFRAIFEEAEGDVADRRWAWLKRWRGPFYPDLWFLARETLDQDPVGYAFVGTHEAGVDGSYYLTAVGAVQEHRHSTEMLRRLVLSLLQELSARSPLGRIETSLSLRDPKLIQVLFSLGFLEQERYGMLVSRPG